MGLYKILKHGWASNRQTTYTIAFQSNISTSGNYQLLYLKLLLMSIITRIMNLLGTTEVPVIAQMYVLLMDVIQLTNHRDAFKTNIIPLVIIHNAVNISLRNQIHLTKPVALSVREKPALQASRMRLFLLQFGVILVLTISVEYCRAQSKKTLFLRI